MHASCLSDAVNGFPQTGVVYWRCFQIGALIQHSWYINLCFLVPTFPQGPLPFFYSWFPSPSLWTQTRSLFFFCSLLLCLSFSLWVSHRLPRTLLPCVQWVNVEPCELSEGLWNETWLGHQRTLTLSMKPTWFISEQRVLLVVVEGGSVSRGTQGHKVLH